METTSTSQPTRNLDHAPRPSTGRGLFNSTTILAELEAVYQFCREEKNLARVLSDLPETIKDNIHLTLLSAGPAGGDYVIRWKSDAEEKAFGVLTLLLRKAPYHHGTFITAEAAFDKVKMKTDDPSDLIKLFLRRLKMLMETGDIITTKGQPSGREVLKAPTKETLH